MCVTVGGRSGKADYYYYVCASRQENKENCPGVTVRVDVMDPGLLDYIASEVLTPENVRGLVERSLAAVAEAPDTVSQQRDAVEATIAELDRKIRLVGQQVLDGILAPSDAKALNAPLLAQREAAQLKLATLPQRRELPGVDTVDPERFRAAVLQAWTNKPLDLRREALDRLINRITLTDGGAHVDYAVKDDEPRFRHQAPDGPASGTSPGTSSATTTPTGAPTRCSTKTGLSGTTSPTRSRRSLLVRRSPPGRRSRPTPTG